MHSQVLRLQSSAWTPHAQLTAQEEGEAHRLSDFSEVHADQSGYRFFLFFLISP